MKLDKREEEEKEEDEEGRRRRMMRKKEGQKWEEKYQKGGIRASGRINRNPSTSHSKSSQGREVPTAGLGTFKLLRVYCGGRQGCAHR